MEFWPPYFHPTPTREATARSIEAPLPVTLLDLFYLRSASDARPELVAVMLCLDGTLSAAPASALATLPPTIQSQITTASVQSRGRFRALTAQAIWVATLDAVDQAVEAGGLNDPVYLYSRLQSLIEAVPGTPMITRLSQLGRCTVGRLDLLSAWDTAVTTRFSIPEHVETYVYHLLVPLGPIHMVSHGQAIALVYPTLDPTVFTSPDNSVILLRIAYEVLARLQQDVRTELPGHPFARAALPVPSRQRLEADLLADGYAIRNDIAVKDPTTQHQTTDTTSFLARLRLLAEAWLAPQLQLPPQATPTMYQALLRDILPAIGTDEDLAMQTALAQAVELRYDPPPAAWPASPASSAGQPTTRLEPRPRTTTRPDPPIHAQPQRSVSRRDTWATDFGAPEAERRPATIRLDKDEWARDTEAERDAKVVPAVPTPPTSADWANDFASSKPSPAQPAPAKNDWSDDFA